MPTGRKSLEPWLKDEVDFYPHQIDAVRLLANKKSFILADDMGLGKSLEAIAIYCVDVVRGMASKVLIVCPVSLKENWADEFSKFTSIPATVLIGTKPKRTAAIKAFKETPGPSALIVNYEQVKSHLGELNAMNPKFDVVIYDEAHYIKNPRSDRAKSALALRGNRHFMLTGTPLLNNVSELWALLNKVDPVKFSSYWAFVNRYVVFGGFQDKQIVGVKNEAELQGILNEHMVRRLSKDVLELKDPIPINRYVTMHPEQWELYKSAKDDLLLIDPNTGVEQDIDNALVKFLRLKQICGTTLSITGVDISAKFDRAIVDSQEIYDNGYKAIVFSQFIDSQEAYARRLDALGIPNWTINGKVKPDMRQGIVAEWTRDKRPGVIICGLQVAGVGLNMTAARYVQFLDKLYTPGMNNQAIARANRIGQDITKAVVVVNYLTKNSIESRIEEILNVKEKTFDTVVEFDTGWKRDLLKKLKENM